MSSQSANSSKSKAPKGSVQIKSSNDRLQLVFTWAKKRYYFSTGLPDTPKHRRAAQQKATQIENDMAFGYFDPTLEKYKPQQVLTTQELEQSTEAIPTAPELWKQYREYKVASLKPTTKGYHEALARILDKIPVALITESLKIKAALEKETTVHQTKRIISQLSAACAWAVKRGLLDSNPYEGMASEMPKFRYQLEPAPNAFSEEERDRVINAFEEHRGNWNGRGVAGRGYSHYVSFVSFLFLTGCRPSEAIGLQWKNISDDGSFVYFQGSITLSGTGRPTRVQTSKRNKTPTFPCSQRLRELLLSIRPENVDPNRLVFPSPKGKAINYDNFCRRAWNTVVDPIKPDTTPYSCRDTFITTQILKGMPETAIAQWCDTSVEMMQKHYADFLRLQSLRPVD